MSPYRKTERLAAKLQAAGSPITREQVAELARIKGKAAIDALIKRLTHPPVALLVPLPVRGTYRVAGADHEEWEVFRAWLLRHPGKGQVISPSSDYLRGDDDSPWAAKTRRVMVNVAYLPAALTSAGYTVVRSARLETEPEMVKDLPLHPWL